MQWAISIATAVLGTTGTVLSAYLALRSKRADTRETTGGWGTLSTAWEKRLAQLETSYAECLKRIGELEDEVRDAHHRAENEQRVRWITTLYLRQVLTWAVMHNPQRRPPDPPAELADELARFLRPPGADHP